MYFSNRFPKRFCERLCNRSGKIVCSKRKRGCVCKGSLVRRNGRCIHRRQCKKPNKGCKGKKKVRCRHRSWRHKSLSRCVRRGKRVVRIQTLKRQVRRGCQCVWKYTTRHCKCACKRNFNRYKCLGNRIKVTVFRQRRRRGCACVKRKVRSYTRRVVCRLKPKKKQIKCLGNGKIQVKRFRRRVRKCRCGYRTLIRTHTLRCRLRRALRGVKKGRCKFTRNPFAAYRAHTTYRAVRDNRRCKCRADKKTRYVICACKARKRTTKLCQHHKYKVTIVSRFVKNYRRNGCVSASVKTNSKTVVCRRPFYYNQCPKGKMRGRRYRAYFRRVNCKCRRKDRFVKTISCRCSRRATVVDKRGCSRRTCRRRVRYRIYRLSGHSCVPRYRWRSRRCCCKKSFIKFKPKVVCRFRRGETVTSYTRYIFKSGRCQKKVTDRTRKVRCRPKLKDRKTKCYSNGVYFIKRYRWARRGCRCQYKHVTSFKRHCRCTRKPKTTQQCQYRRRSIRFTTVKWVLRRSFCRKRENSYSKRVRCKRAVHRRGPCNRRQRRQRVTVTRYIVSRSCKCKPKFDGYWTACNCRRSTKHKTTCRRAVGIRVTTTTKIRLRGRRCVVMTSEKKIKVRCINRKNYREIRKSCANIGRYGIREIGTPFYVRRGCACRKKYRWRKCHCKRKCRGKVGIRKCLYGGLKVRYIYRLKYDGCRCRKVYLYTVKKHIKCRRPKLKMGKCNKRNCLKPGEATVWYLRKCRCIRRTKEVSRRCCCRKKVSSTRCINNCIVKKTIRWRLWRHRCRKFEKKSTAYVVCRKHEVTIGRCKGRTKFVTLVVKRGRVVNCRCITKETRKSIACGCPKKIIKIGRCNRRNCKQRIVITNFKLIGKRCLKRSRRRDRRCCCNDKRRINNRTICKGRRKVRINVSWRFQRKIRKCRRVWTETDKTVYCYPRRKIIKSGCRRDGRRKITIITKVKVRCHCKRRIRYRYKRCRCPKSRTRRYCVGKVLKIVKVFFKKRRDQCILRKEVKHRRLLVCGAERRHFGSCKRSSCKQAVTIYYWQPINCKCRKKKKTITVICCCRRRTRRGRRVIRHCNRRRGVMIEKRRGKGRFIRHLRACVREISTKEIPTVCRRSYNVPQNDCHMWKGRSLRRVMRVHIRRVGCRCVSRKTMHYYKCHCPALRKRILKKCFGHILKIYAIRMVRVKKACKRLYKLVRSKIVRCRKSRVLRRHRCKRNGIRMYIVETRWRNGCRCLVKRQARFTNCHCRAYPVIPKRSCKNGKVTIRTYYHRLVCRKGFWAHCSCRRTFKSRHYHVATRAPVIQKGRCNRHGMRQIKVTIFKVDSCCKLRKRVYRRRAPCRARCLDALPFGSCRLAEHKGHCERIPLVRKKLCRRTCGFCWSCRGKVIYHKQKKTTLRAERVSRSLIIRSFRVSNVRECQRACQRKKRCRSFEIRRENGRNCILNSVNLATLRRRVRKEIITFKATRTLYTKICQRKCPSTIAKKLGPCVCISRRHSACWRLYSITSWKHKDNGKCKKHVYTTRLHCHKPCIDQLPRRQCLALKRKGSCKNPQVTRVCSGSCYKRCHCNQRATIPKERCHKMRNIYVAKAIIFTWRLYRGTCRVLVRKGFKRCRVKTCHSDLRIRVMPCSRGLRSVAQIKYVQDFSKLGRIGCRRVVRRKTYRCGNCCRSVIARPTKCIRGRMHINIKFWVNIRANTCLTMRRRAMGRCDGCPRSRIHFNGCVLGHRLVYRIWYMRSVEYKGCKKHVAVQTKACKSRSRAKRRAP